MRAHWLSLGLVLIGEMAFAQSSAFDGHSDIGTVLHAGSDIFDDHTGTYLLSGSGANMWFGEDDFHFVWKKVSGDVALSAIVSFPETGGDPHRKAVLMIRQSLDPDSAYADAALHGDGLTSLQFRTAKGEATHEIRSSQSAPRRLQIEKRGDLFYLSVAPPHGDVHFSGGSVRVVMTAPGAWDGKFYVGIGVCAHNQDRVEKAAFTNVLLSGSTTYSTLETIDIASTDALATYVKSGSIEKPAWSADGASLVFLSEGRMYSVPAAGGEARPAASDAAGNDPSARSPDGKWIASFSQENGETALRITSTVDNKTRVLATFAGPDSSAMPAWSPDSRRIAFVSHQQF
jgi:TolB protein